MANSITGGSIGPSLTGGPNLTGPNLTGGPPSVFGGGNGFSNSGLGGGSTRISARSSHGPRTTTGMQSAGPAATNNTITGKDSGLEKLPLSTNGSCPKWRYVSSGLCVEGRCGRESCEAKGRTVICCLGFTSVDLVKDGSRFKCPVCMYTIEPAKVAFYKCEWKVAGIKRANADAPPETVDQQEWEVCVCWAGVCVGMLNLRPQYRLGQCTRYMALQDAEGTELLLFAVAGDW